MLSLTFISPTLSQIFDHVIYMLFSNQVISFTELKVAAAENSHLIILYIDPTY